VERLDKLVVWAERTRAETIGNYLGRKSPFLRQTRVRVKVVDFPRTEVLEHAVRQLAADGGTEDGADLPDIVVGPHDWIGGVANSRWVEALPLSRQEQSRFHPATMAALHHDGRLVAAPYVFDTVALIRNNRLAGNGPMPSTLADVIASGQQAVAAHRITDGLALALQVGPPNPAGEAGDPYHMWPLFSSAGGSFFGLRRTAVHATGVDDTFDDLERWKGDFIEAFGKLATLGCGAGGLGVLDPQIGRPEAIKAFVEQRAPYLVCSSRALKCINQKGMDVTVAAVPPLGSRPAVPMVSVYGFFVYRHAPNMTAATDVLFQYLANAEAGVDLQRFQPLVPVQRGAMGRVGESDPRLAPYVEQSRNGMIMPSYPEMREAWNLMGMAEYRILAGDGDPETIAATTADAGWDLLRAARQPSR
jgi:arabinogalactan oligomer/maltooligosaccharide transport system substrate-binding protein